MLQKRLQVSEKYSLEWFLDRIGSRDFKDFDWTSLGEASINAFIRDHGGSVNEDLDYAQADARHWHQGYLKMKDAYEDMSSRLRSMQEEQRQRGDDAERDVNELLGSREADRHYIAVLEERVEELNEKVNAYKSYVELLKGQNSDIEDHIRAVDKPLESDHPALVEKGKEEYSRGWDDAIAEQKPKIERLKAMLDDAERKRDEYACKLNITKGVIRSDDMRNIKRLESENHDIFEELKVMIEERDKYANDVAHLKDILEENREDQQNNVRIYSGYIHDRDDMIQDLTNRLNDMEAKKNEWKNLTLQTIAEILSEGIDGKSF